MSMKAKLQRFREHIIHSQAEQPLITQSVPTDEQQLPMIPYLEEWKEFQVTPYYFDGSYALIREVNYPLEYQHGKYKLSELQDTVQSWKAYELDHPLSSSEKEVSELFFFDTETTGLSSGAGNTIFLLGCIQVLADRAVLRQYFLPNPGGEVALYQAFLSDVDYTTLVSYNGKAFDWPQVKTRHTLIRDAVPKLPAFGHYDLLHGVRRIWKDSLPSCRLSVVEEEILGIQRTEDTPGYLAPMLYFEFLKEQHPDQVKGIFLHNETDVLSLVSLYIHLSRVLMHDESYSLGEIERFKLARWFAQVGDVSRAIRLYQRLLDPSSSVYYQTGMGLAEIYKRAKEMEKAVVIWKKLCSQSALSSPAPYIELAKVCEHHFKDPEEALMYASKAYEIWKESKRFGNKKEQDKQAFTQRIQRLQKKCMGKE